MVKSSHVSGGLWTPKDGRGMCTVLRALTPLLGRHTQIRAVIDVSLERHLNLASILNYVFSALNSP